MSQPRYEILIRFNDATGALQGAHFRAMPDGLATAIRPEHWPAEVKGINHAALAAWETATEAAHEKDLALKTLEEKALAQITTLQKTAEAAAKEAAEVLAAVTQERDAALAESQHLRATLTEHQQISDSLVTTACTAINAGDYDALGKILHQASLFGAAREAARLDAEAAELQAKLDAIAAAKAKLS